MSAVASTLSDVHSPYEEAIRALLDRLHDAWARGDGTAYAACFTEDSDYVTYCESQLMLANAIN